MKDFSYEQIKAMINYSADTMDGYMYVWDIVRDYYCISPRAVERFSLPAAEFDEALSSHFLYVHPDDQAELTEDMNRVLYDGKNFHNMEYRWLLNSGEPAWISCRGRILREENGDPIFMIGCINEIGSAQKADNLSGLRRLDPKGPLSEAINRDGFHGFILRIGIDGLRSINAHQGRQYGDAAIRRAVDCMLTVAGTNTFEYRRLEDEFIIINNKYGTFVDALQLYLNIRVEVAKQIEQHDYDVVFTLSAGILASEDVGSSYEFESLNKMSEYALNRAKDLGKNVYWRFDMKDYIESLYKRRIMIELEQSLRKNFRGFSVAYQPIIGKDGKVEGAEALMRYSAENGAVVSPGVFIPLLEDNGFIIPAGRWILDAAVRDCKELQNYIPDFKMHVNISYVQIQKTDIVSDVLRIIERYDLSPESLTVELTESGFLESSIQYNIVWSNFREAGIRIALDDFGTGYSNFHYLNRMKPDMIKVDRTFTRDAVKDEYEYGLMENLRHMADNLHLKFCIEGIEDDDEFGRMTAMKPDCYQGFYFGKPGSYEQLLQRCIEDSRR